jgi:hypothetical protein
MNTVTKRRGIPHPEKKKKGSNAHPINAKEKEKPPHHHSLLPSSILMTSASRIRPPRQPIRNIAHITTGRARGSAQIPIHGLNAAVVASGSGVSIRVVVQVRHQAVAVPRALDAVLDHVPDGLVGVVGVEFGAFVRLHDAWVVHAAGGGGGFYFGAAVGLGLLVGGF